MAHWRTVGFGQMETTIKGKKVELSNCDRGKWNLYVNDRLQVVLKAHNPMIAQASAEQYMEDGRVLG